MPNRDRAAVTPASRSSDATFRAVCWAIGGTVVAVPVGIVGFLAVNGLGVVDASFLADAPDGFPLGRGGGIWPAIQGSLALVAIGLAIAVPTGVLGAVYASEYCGSAAALKAVRFVAEVMAAVPSIVYGLFGYAFLVVFLSLKVSLLAGGATLGLLMFPVVFIGAHEALLAVDAAYRRAALSLGVSRARYVRRILLPSALPAILSIVVLAATHAAGSAAPVLYTAAIIHSTGGLDLAAPVMTLPTHLFFLVGEAVSFDHAFGTALVLVLGLLAGNFAAVAIRRRVRRDHE